MPRGPTQMLLICNRKILFPPHGRVCDADMVHICMIPIRNRGGEVIQRWELRIANEVTAAGHNSELREQRIPCSSLS